MDASRFDRLTRAFSSGTPRRILFAGGAAALLGRPLVTEDAAAKKKKKKKRKRCKHLHEGCKPGGKRKCCKVLFCAPTTPFGSDHRCCKGIDAECATDDECCTENCSLTLGCQLPE